MKEERDFMSRLLRPRSIVFVGASADIRKSGGRALKNLIDKEFEGDLYLVHPKHDSVHGIKTYSSIAAVPKIADLGIVGLPASMVPETIGQLGEAGIKMAVVFSSGFGELGEEGEKLERECREIAFSYGMRLLGPNTLGFVNAIDGVCPSFSQFAQGEVKTGPIAFVTQSGAFGTAIASLARRRNLGIGYFIHTGNEVNTGFAEVMDHVIGDEKMKVGAAYLESVRDGRELLGAAKKARELDKPLLITKVGRTQSGQRAAASHTGALATNDAVFDGIVKQFNVIRTPNEGRLLDILDLIVNCPRPTSGGIGLVTQSGGAGVLMADKAEEMGLEVPILSEQTRNELTEVLPSFAALSNPVDVTAAFVADPRMLTSSVEIMLKDPAIGIGLVWLQLMESNAQQIIDALIEIRERTDKPFVVVWVAAPELAESELRNAHLPMFTSGEDAISAIAALMRYVRRQDEFKRWDAQNRAPVTSAGESVNLLQTLAEPDKTVVVPTMEGANILRSCGASCVDTGLATTPDEAVALADRFGYPVVLKIESPDILHKSDVGGLQLNLGDAESVRTAYESLTKTVCRNVPSARITGVIVQNMAKEGIEVVVGLKRDPVFGLVIMLGLGGVFVEVLKDVTFRKVPLTPLDVDSMLSDLRGAAILDGVRGKPGVDKKALAKFVCAVSEFAAEAEDCLSELDLNPVICTADGVMAVDWLMVLEPPAPR